MMESAILAVAYIAGCVTLALRRQQALGQGAGTLLNRIRDLGPSLLLLPLALTGFGLFGSVLWPAIVAVALAGLAVVFAPKLAAKALPPILIALGLYGFVLVRGYLRGSQTPVLYGVLPAGRWSWPTYLILPQAYAFLAVGLWLAWRQLGLRSRLAAAVLWRPPAQPGCARRPRWGLLLLPVLGMTIELLGQNWWFSVNGWGPRSTAAVVLIALIMVILLPAAAADLAVAALAALGLYGIGLAALPNQSWHASSTVRYGAILVSHHRFLGLLAGGQGVLLLAFGLWLVPRALDARTRALFWSAPAAELAGRVEKLTQTRADAVDTAAAELRRVERDLHDGAQARLVALGMSLRAAQRLIPGSPQAAQSLVAEAIATSSKALTELRDLVRGIHPPVLADRGLGDAVRALALDTPLHTETDIDVPGRLDAPVESACYFAVAEALTNAVKHSGARHVQIRMQHARGMLRIEVTDDGAGGADPASGSGLRGLERRLGTFDGILAVSSPPGGPTMIVIEVPCALSSPKISSS
jgi:signal transduction histidine kinase